MPKWYGRIGFSTDSDQGFGIFEKTSEARPYYGDIIHSRPGWTAVSDSTNEKMTVNSRISVVADDFALQNTYRMTWIEYLGTKWYISSVELAFPRIIVDIGNVYTEEVLP